MSVAACFGHACLYVSSFIPLGGTTALRNSIPLTDALHVERLREAGAVILVIEHTSWIMRWEGRRLPIIPLLLPASTYKALIRLEIYFIGKGEYGGIGFKR